MQIMKMNRNLKTMAKKTQRRFYLVCKKGLLGTKILKGFWNLEKAREFAADINKAVILRQVEEGDLEPVSLTEESGN